METSKEFGKSGEEVAATFLEEKGYLILERNWRLGKEEIDIIASHDGFLVVVEVKSRRSRVFAEPEASVTKHKQRVLARAANAYARYKGHPGEVRFDIVTVVELPTSRTINHIVDAFYVTM